MKKTLLAIAILIGMHFFDWHLHMIQKFLSKENNYIVYNLLSDFLWRSGITDYDTFWCIYWGSALILSIAIFISILYYYRKKKHEEWMKQISDASQEGWYQNEQRFL